MRLTTILFIIQFAALAPTAGFIVMSYLHHGKIEWGLVSSCAGLIVSMLASVLARKDGV